MARLKTLKTFDSNPHSPYNNKSNVPVKLLEIEHDLLINWETKKVWQKLKLAHMMKREYIINDMFGINEINLHQECLVKAIENNNKKHGENNISKLEDTSELLQKEESDLYSPVLSIISNDTFKKDTCVEMSNKYLQKNWKEFN